MASLVFLGFSVIAFVISYGLMFTLVPIVFGTFFSIDMGELDPDWQATKDETVNVLQFLIPLVPTIGIFILVIKVIMVASGRGSD